MILLVLRTIKIFKDNIINYFLEWMVPRPAWSQFDSQRYGTGLLYQIPMYLIPMHTSTTTNVLVASIM